MATTTSLEVSRLIRQLRGEAGLTQSALARRVGTTQSVISRLEGADYQGHSLSMLYRIGAVLDRKITVAASAEDPTALSVRERAPSYAAAAEDPGAPDDRLSRHELERLAERLAQRFSEQGVTKLDVEEAIRWARRATHGRSVADLQGAIKVGAGDIVDDVRRARAQRGREPGR